MAHQDIIKLNADVILDSISDGVYVTDVERRILYWSKSAEQITGWSRDEMIGQLCHDRRLAHVDKDGHELCGEEYCPLYRAIITGEGGAVPTVVFARRRDGRRIPLHLSVAPIRDAKGKIIGGVETFQDLSDQYEELAWAQRIQSLTLHRDLPHDERLEFAVHYIPRDMVGGDFYAIQPLGKRTYAFMVADVVGHGVAAALLTMQLHTLWQEHRPLIGDPEAFARLINANLRSLMQRDDAFATGIFGRFDSYSGELALVSAGNPYPLRFLAGGKQEIIRCSGLPLGLMEDYTPETHRLQLKGGDRVLFFTDGAIEIFDNNHRILGIEGFLDLLLKAGYSNGRMTLENVEEHLLRWSNDLRLRDDLTLLELHFKPLRKEEPERIRGIGA